MERSGVRFYDQVCYRIVIHLCGQYNRPDLAVHVFNKMLCACGTRPNALTYGIYHNALITAMWPPKARLVALDAWRRLRMRIEVCTLFRIHSGIEEFECSYLPNQNQVSSTNELAANNSGLDSSSISRLQDHECDHSDANSLGMSSISKLAEASEVFIIYRYTINHSFVILVLYLFRRCAIYKTDAQKITGMQIFLFFV